MECYSYLGNYNNLLEEHIMITLLLKTLYGFGCGYLVALGIVGAMASNPIGFVVLFIGIMGTLPFRLWR